MKKVFLCIITVIFTISCFLTVLYADNTPYAKVYFNNLPIPYMESGEEVFIRANDLKHYGFDVLWDSNKLKITENPNKILCPVDTDTYKLQTRHLGDSKVYIENKMIKGKRLNNEMYINIKSFNELSNFYYTNDKKDNTYDIGTKYKHIMTNPKENVVNITQKGDDLYCNDDKIGFIKNDLEMVSMVYLGKMLGFHLGGRKYKNTFEEYAKQGKYEFHIYISEEEDKYTAEVTWNNSKSIYKKDLISRPISIDDELYVPLIDLKQLMNLKITKPYVSGTKMQQENYCGTDMIKDGQWLYYTNSDNHKLYKINQNISIKVCDDYVKSFIVENNKIYYIGNKGIYNISGSNKKLIVEDDVNYICLHEDYIYYCTDKGLYKIKKDGTCNELVLDCQIKMPNIINDYIYYINKEDKSSIYKIKTDGTNKRKINNTYAEIFKVDGENIYFTNSKGIYSINVHGNYEKKLACCCPENLFIEENSIYWLEGSKNIYKLNKNKIVKELVYGGATVNRVLVEKDKVYLIDNEKTNKTYCIDAATLQKETLNIPDMQSIQYVSNSSIYYKSQKDELKRYNINTKELQTIIKRDFNSLYKVKNNWVYYWQWGNNGGLYRIKLNGNKKTMLTNNDTARISVEDDAVYFLESHRGTIGNLCKINLDGTNKKTLIDDLEKDYHFVNKIYKDYIFYLQSNGLYKIKTDGSNKTCIFKDDIYDYEVADDKIYYGNNDGLYTIDLDGKSKVRILSSCKLGFKIHDNNVYFLNDDENLFRYNLSRKSINKLTHYKIDKILDVVDNNVYFCLDNKIYRVNLGQENKTILEDEEVDLYNLYINEDRIVYSTFKYENSLKILK